MPTPSSTIDKAGLLALLAQGETRQAIELLRASGELMAHPEKSSRITLLSGRYYRNAADFQEGTITYEAHKVEVTQISDALKQFIDQLPDEPLSVLSLPPLPADIQRPEHPYTGLHWFTREDARIFFGRGRDYPPAL
ncbi:MAG: hypothetical protein IPN74_01805 [Haliscomenobacter sp.]|nr:hypothetical protein [Haliscomenobacter sp.]MBK8877313.1 hypothetical protein [Haliscomenobacter sp.]